MRHRYSVRELATYFHQEISTSGANIKHAEFFTGVKSAEEISKVL